MNTSVPSCLLHLPSEQSRPPPPSLLTTKHSKTPLIFLRAIVLALLMWTGLTDNHCYTISSSISSSNCQICQSSVGMTCIYTASDGTMNILAPSDCPNTCCNSTQFDNPSQYSLCAPQGTNSNIDNSNQLSLPTILIIIFFSVPAGICLLIAICSCVNGRRHTEESGGE